MPLIQVEAGDLWELVLGQVIHLDPISKEKNSKQKIHIVKSCVKDFGKNSETWKRLML